MNKANIIVNKVNREIYYMKIHVPKKSCDPYFPGTNLPIIHFAFTSYLLFFFLFFLIRFEIFCRLIFASGCDLLSAKKKKEDVCFFCDFSSYLLKWNIPNYNFNHLFHDLFFCCIRLHRNLQPIFRSITCIFLWICLLFLFKFFLLFFAFPFRVHR